MQPQDQIVGSTVLRIPAIQSPDYVPGVSGWIIRQDGTAEFNGATFRGNVVIQNNEGVLLYSSTPALGNLVGSISPTGGTDSFGNTYPTGFMFTNGTLKFAATVETFLGNLVPIIQLFTGGGSEEVPFHIASAVFGTAGVGAGRFYDTKIVSAANTNTDDVAFIELSSSSDVTADVPCFGSLAYNSGINSGGSLLTVLTWGFAGGAYTGAATAIHPGTGTSPADPAVAETWQTPTPNAGWALGSNDGTAQQVAYRTVQDNTIVHILGSIHSTSTTPNANFWTMPAVYRPSVNQRSGFVEVAGTSAFANELGVATTGNVGPLIVTNAGGTDYHFDNYYRLS